MQVRVDTRACEAFSPLNQPAKPPPAKPLPPKRAEPRRGGLCGWGRVVLLAALIIIILLLAWGAYTLFFGRTAPTPTPTPTPTTTPVPTTGPTPTGFPTPTPTPTPFPIYQYNLGEWVAAPPVLMLASSAEKMKQYDAPGPQPAPEGTSYIIVSVTVTNGSTGTIGVGANQFTIVSNSGFAFPPMQPPLLFYNAFVWYPANLGPGKTTGGRIIYIVPDAISELSFQTMVPTGIVQWKLPW